MKKIITLLVTVVMCITLAACSGGVDKQPAIDSFNELCDNYNRFVELGNAEIDSISEEDIDFFNNFVEELDAYGEQLESDTEFTQEEIDEMVEMFDEYNDIIVEALEEMGE